MSKRSVDHSTDLLLFRDRIRAAIEIPREIYLRCKTACAKVKIETKKKLGTMRTPIERCDAGTFENVLEINVSTAAGGMCLLGIYARR